MAGIREELQLVDKFSAVFNKFTQAAQRAAANCDDVKAAIDAANASPLDRLLTSTETLAANMQLLVEKLDQVETAQNNVTEATNRTASASTNWLSVIKRAATALGAVKLAQSFIETADTMSQITAKFGLITSDESEAAALQEQIFQAAQRSRGAYEDMANTVTKLRQNAGQAFTNNAEALQFAENLNKTFKLAGASQAEMSSASLQLTQALGSGALRGEEFRAVFEAAPAVIQRIADEMDVPIGQMKDLASEGKITADIVKAAMLGATDDINAQFETLPMTFADMITAGKNNIQMALADAFEGWTQLLNSAEVQAMIADLTAAFIVLAQIGSSAMMAITRALTWLHQNMQRFTPLLYVAAGAAALFGAVMVASAVASAISWLAVNWPLLLIIGLITSIIIAAQKMGVTFSDVGNFIGQTFGWLYGVVYNLVADLWNVIAVFAEFFANVFNDPLGSVMHLFVDVFDAILSIVETVAAAIDALTGSDWAGTISNFRNDMQAWADEKYGAKAITVERMEKLDGVKIAQNMAKFGEIGENLGAKLDNFELNLDDLIGLNNTQASAIDSNGAVNQVTEVGSIKNDVKLSDEDLKLYRDIAEAKYMRAVEVTTLAPNVSVNVENAQDLNAEDIGEIITNVIIEQVASHTAVSHG